MNRRKYPESTPGASASSWKTDLLRGLRLRDVRQHGVGVQRHQCLAQRVPATTCLLVLPRASFAQRNSTWSGRARSDSTNLGNACRHGPRCARLQFSDRRRLDIFIKHRWSVRPARPVNKAVPKTVQNGHERLNAIQTKWLRMRYYSLIVVFGASLFWWFVRVCFLLLLPHIRRPLGGVMRISLFFLPRRSTSQTTQISHLV